MRVGVVIPLQADVDSCIRPMHDLGFTSGQLTVWDMSLYNQETAKKIEKACHDYHFTVTAIWCGWSGPVVWKYPDMYDTLGLVPDYLRERRLFDLLAGAKFAKELGIRDVVTHIGFFPDNPFDSRHIQIAQCLRLIGNELNKSGQRFLFETGEELPVTLVQLIEEIGTGNMGVNFDPANLMMNGRANPVDAMDLLGPYLMGLHGKDGRYPQGREPKGKEFPLGKGQVDYPALLKKVKALNYQGDITIEREIPSGPERDKDLVNGKKYLESLWNEV
jgi:sugar phosphate isomerase/epimerase